MNADINHYCRIIEALLFASPEAMSTRTIRKYLPDDTDDALYDAVMEALGARYGVESGLELCQMDGHWAFRTRTDIAAHLEALREAEKPLSRAGLETLAIIAYHQPITRAEIEEIRGCVYIQRHLGYSVGNGLDSPERQAAEPRTTSDLGNES